ncbi:MAG TPA: C40 family peptidase [Bacteroidales bacterium]|nr:C40 family peptidase [Bacteroidales bacterium]
MLYGICTLSVVPMRREPSERSEMVSQLLFGELLWILERQGNWLFARTALDDYEGWIDIKQVTQIGEDFFRYYHSRTNEVVTDMSAQLFDGRERRHLLIPAGSTMPGIRGRVLEINGKRYILDGETNRIILADRASVRKYILEIATRYLDTPYLWGGRSPFGLDCSGFVQIVFKICGIRLRRDSAQQAMEGRGLSFLSESRPGDLAFFDDKEGRITHVGILMGDDRIIHCSGKVRIDPIDQQGIYHKELQRYTHRLRLINSCLAE